MRTSIMRKTSSTKSKDILYPDGEIFAAYVIKRANSLNSQRALRYQGGALTSLKNEQRTGTENHKKRRVNESLKDKMHKLPYNKTCKAEL